MASIASVPGTRGFQRGTPAWWRRFGFEWYHDWSSFLFWRVNWSDFTLINISGEIEWHMGSSEVCLALLGLHVRFTYYWPNENREALTTTARLFEAGFIDGVELPDALILPPPDGGSRNR